MKTFNFVKAFEAHIALKPYHVELAQVVFCSIMMGYIFHPTQTTSDL
jgi:hypothetical protein